MNGYHPNGPSGKKIAGFMVEYESYIYMETMGAIVGFDSKKNASIDGVYKNGTATDPVKVVKGDVILFEITAVNSSRDNHMVSIYDSIPKGLEVIESSITDDGDYFYDPLEDQAYINWWGVEIPLEGKKVVSFKAKPASKTTKLMKNTARVTSGNNPPTLAMAAQAPPLYEFQTDTTYHLGKICEVSFDYEPGGTHSGLDTTQILDYGDKPKAGVIPIPPPGRKFVGWSYPEYTSWKDEVKPAALGIMDYTTITAYGDIPLTARWDFRFDPDTLVSCEPPMKLESGHDGLSYEWILPDGTKKTTEDIQAQTSGKYILNTNYGSMITSDTVIVLFAFDENVKIVDLSPAGPKVDRPQIYTVSVDTALKNVSYQWSFSGGGDPATSTADTATVVYKSTGTKKISVTVTVTMPGSSIVCTKTFTLDIKIYGEKRNFFVDRNVAGGNEDGSSWTHAYRRVEDALNKATSGDCIWVARGEYTPPTNSSYMLNHDSVEIYGGFGAWEDYIDERDYGKNPTILRGSGTSVIVNTNAGKASRWDGFTIQGGDAEKGGGIFNNNSFLTIANCIIRNNKAVEGSGIYTLQGDPLFYNLEVSGNTAQDGTVYTDSGDPRMINVTISGNRATNGGGLYNSNANPKIYNSIIWGNKADGNAVMVNSSNSSPYFTYNLIERYGDVDRWDASYGINGGNNIGGSPLFKRNGFDKDGNMQVGDYRLDVSSPGINRGLDRFIYDIPVRSGTHLETLTETKYLSVIPYDVQNKNRIEFDRIDLGAYEYARDEALPTILRQVYLPDVAGLRLDPAPGENFVESQKDFIFTIAALPGYSLDDLKIETGDELRDKEGLKIVLNEDSTVTVTLIKVTQTILVTINGTSPTLSNEVGNDDIESGQKVWSFKNNLHINTDKQIDIQIYSVAGQLYLQQSVDAGETIISLKQGIYFVRMDDQTYKVVIRV